jgi:hypothetical protein
LQIANDDELSSSDDMENGHGGAALLGKGGDNIWVDDEEDESNIGDGLDGPSWVDHRSLEATYHHIIDKSNENRKQAMLEREKVKLYPTSVRFINGLASSYEDDWPFQLEGQVSDDLSSHCMLMLALFMQIKIEEYTAAINQINNTLDDYWPCDFCFYCGYFCCPCTLGLSLFCPNLCISDVSLFQNRKHLVVK